MRLSELIRNIKDYSEQNISLCNDPKINNISYDSRNINPGDVFVAIRGLKTDGHYFIEKAIERGAVAIVYQDEVQMNKIIPYIRVSNTRKYLAQMACIINNNPSKNLTMIGITGTNGKTTTSYIIEQIINKAGYDPGVIGTINHRFKTFKKEHSSTTPESPELQRIMHNMVELKTSHVIMEVSSHALDLHRVEGCKFDTAVFTNLTQDHLDYHQDMATYWSVKQKLFTKHLKKGGIAVINIDDDRGKYLFEKIRKNGIAISTGNSTECDVRPISIKYSSAEMKGKISTPKGEFTFHSPLIGKFNLNNILSATGAGIAMDFSTEDISAGINTTSRIPGRLDLLDNTSKISVYIDYAHTPDALEKVLQTIHFIKKGRIITIFGCGGNRDYIKRSIMGKIAIKYSDLSIITSDNPRFEDPEHINDQIVKGVHQVCTNHATSETLLNKRWESKSYAVISDRKEAIYIGIHAANSNDSVLIAGKGHETYQIIGHKAFQFDDKKEAAKVLQTIIKQ